MQKKELIKPRAFKTKHFAKTAKGFSISDQELCDAIDELNQGIYDADLGGDVYKKRINKNLHRAILLHKVGEYWIFSYVFAKSDRSNIKKNELAAFKFLSDQYKLMSVSQLQALLDNGELVEICHECEKNNV